MIAYCNRFVARGNKTNTHTHAKKVTQYLEEVIVEVAQRLVEERIGIVKRQDFAFHV